MFKKNSNFLETYFFSKFMTKANDKVFNNAIGMTFFVVLMALAWVGMNTFSPYKGTVGKYQFLKADPNGAPILESLIKKGILEEIPSNESKRAAGRVRLKKDSQIVTRPPEMLSNNFNAIWNALIAGRPRSNKIGDPIARSE
jgi:hypothetical protein